MLARIRKAMDENEEGFTLIELLVVMIIIGILAAIAIPVFLNQRDNGYRSAIQSDLRNAATAIESYAVSTGGDYSALAGDVIWDDGAAVTGALVEFNGSSDVTVTVASATTTDYRITATHSLLNNNTETWEFEKTVGQPVAAAPATP